LQGFAVTSSLARGALGRDDKSFDRVKKAPGDGSDLIEESPCVLRFRSGNGASDLQEPQVAIHFFG
jgi:hypothetical protein